MLICDLVILNGGFYFLFLCFCWVETCGMGLENIYTAKYKDVHEIKSSTHFRNSEKKKIHPDYFLFLK